ncbi:methyltransferase [Brevibacillus reuszeri]|uniref:RraA family protein n=1 Tax=Brevibacillus reuszeri TaxID=54915 RepID=UPI001B1473E3|nr:RraA family protein [Brevibacillus reuszeri]GIO09936.1 methyltransferase [Brevibacillus reuszeri]
MSTIASQYQNVPTTCISDALQGMTNMDSSIKPLKEEYRIAGRAFTVQMPIGDNLTVLQAIREAQPGDVLVIDAKGDTYRAIAGDFIVGLAKTLGIQGIVVDGVIRDIIGIKQLDFPVFCKGTTVAASGKAGWGQINVPISCGGTSISPGDMIVGDADGVVVIPQSIEQEILSQALDKLAKDQVREANVSGNPDAVRAYLDEFLANAKRK